ncbi:MAG: IS21-like element helper ATPase IstB [Legionella sp.]|nr:IS21-like element helper ATPase IstB [Legionella sp.]
MRLSAMADLHQEHVKNNSINENTPDEYLALLAEHEWEHRENLRIARLIKQAKFGQKASVEEVDYVSVRNLDKNSFSRLATLEFMKSKENLIVTGASGVGKSYLGQALGHQACIKGYKVLYSNTARLFTKFKLAKVDGTYIKELQKLQKINLLILDDFGLQAFDNNARDVLMDIIDDRFNKMSTIVSSQLPVSLWYDIIGEGTIADAILDRLVNSSHRINLNGESLRKGFLNKQQ